jgi:hypothetical protein
MCRTGRWFFIGVATGIVGFVLAFVITANVLTKRWRRS